MTARVTLRAKGRIAKLNGSPLIVSVGLGFAKSGYEGVYRHPEVEFRILSKDGSDNFISNPEIRLTFQTNTRQDRDRRGPLGFLRMGSGDWVGCYAMKISAQLGYPGHARNLSRIMALIEKVRDASEGYYRARYERGLRGDPFKGCELLRLLWGLQACGVEVRIYNEQLPSKATRSILRAA